MSTTAATVASDLKVGHAAGGAGRDAEHRVPPRPRVCLKGSVLYGGDEGGPSGGGDEERRPVGDLGVADGDAGGVVVLHFEAAARLATAVGGLAPAGG